MNKGNKPLALAYASYFCFFTSRHMKGNKQWYFACMHTHTQYLVLCQKIMHVPDFNDFFFSKQVLAR